MRAVIRGLIFAVVSHSSAAADVTGAWSGMLTGAGTHGPNETTVYAVLRQDGERVTGSVGADKTHQLAIRNCRIEGTVIAGETVEWEGMVFRFKVSTSATEIRGLVEVVSPGGNVAQANLKMHRAK